MSGTLDWHSNTNLQENSCQGASCTCKTSFELYQQMAMQLVSNKKSGVNHYKLEPSYEARAKRIAGAYASVFLEEAFTYGDINFLGRYYWMGIGTFASKTMAMVFGAIRSQSAYALNIKNSQEAINILAKGNLWLFMDILLWHLAWSNDSKNWNYCLSDRPIDGFTNEVKLAVLNLPWSSVLPKLSYLQVTPEILNAFNKQMPEIERIFKSGKTRKDKFLNAQTFLFEHMKQIAIQEQKNILQKICWDNPILRKNVEIQRDKVNHCIIAGASIDTTLVLSSQYDINIVKLERKIPLSETSKLEYDPWNSPPEGMQVENYDSRMKWILEGAAPQYHKLMMVDKGRAYLIQELEAIAKWKDYTPLTPDFMIWSSSNEGKR